MRVARDVVALGRKLREEHRILVRQPLSSLTDAIYRAGFLIERIVESLPLETMRDRWPHDYDKLVTPEEIRSGAPELRWEEPVGVSYQPLGSGWSLSSDISINYMIAGMKR